MALVSVVIPAYNAAKSLAESVESVCRQSLKEIDIWIVDDGSTDDTPRIADDLGKRDPRIHVVHQKNSGCYQARLAAFRRMSSPYFASIDADDVLEPEMLQTMLTFAKEQRLDVVECRCYHQYPPKKKGADAARTLFEGRPAVMDGVIRPYLESGVASFYVCAKLYRNQYDFSRFEATDHVTMFEDLIFNLQFMLPVERYGIIDEPLYWYRINSGSTVSNFNLGNVKDFSETLRARAAYLPQYGLSATSAESDKWFAKNMRNYLIKACVARASSWRMRMDNVRALLSVCGLDDAMERGQTREVDAFAWVRRFERFPLAVSVFAIRLAKLLQMRIKRLMGRA